MAAYSGRFDLHSSRRRSPWDPFTAPSRSSTHHSFPSSRTPPSRTHGRSSNYKTNNIPNVASYGPNPFKSNKHRSLSSSRVVPPPITCRPSHINDNSRRAYATAQIHMYAAAAAAAPLLHHRRRPRAAPTYSRAPETVMKMKIKVRWWWRTVADVVWDCLVWLLTGVVSACQADRSRWVVDVVVLLVWSAVVASGLWWLAITVANLWWWWWLTTWKRPATYYVLRQTPLFLGNVASSLGNAGGDSVSGGGGGAGGIIEAVEMTDSGWVGSTVIRSVTEMISLPATDMTPSSALATATLAAISSLCGSTAGSERGHLEEGPAPHDVAVSLGPEPPAEMAADPAVLQPPPPAKGATPCAVPPAVTGTDINLDTCPFLGIPWRNEGLMTLGTVTTTAMGKLGAFLPTTKDSHDELERANRNMHVQESD